ncbi:MAG: J domain-containing protein [Flavobacteriales bacterium]
MARRSTHIDPYAILGVHAGSSATEIKRAYRERVLRCHPDIDPSPNAAEVFRNVHEAYRILSDPAQRFLFEQRGSSRPAPPRQHRDRPFAQPRMEPEDPFVEEPGRPIDPWLFKGLHITGLLFGICCVGGISAGYLFQDWPSFMLIFMVPGLLVFPDCWAVLFVRPKRAR